MAKRLNLLPLTLPCMATLLLTACGGGSSGPTYNVSASAGTNGSISPSTAAVTAGGTTTFNVEPESGYAIASVTGCGGSLSGSTYTTGPISASCTVTAAFSAAFTWVGGLSTAGANGVYGTLNAAAKSDLPGARAEGLRWQDADGNLWLFGGYGYDATDTTADDLNDLWEYSPSSNEWTWIGGSKTTGANGVYGTLGVAATTSIPGARDSAVTWLDAGGNLWLFGGFGYDATDTTSDDLNDLWEYSPSTGEWTWIGGSKTTDSKGVYGTQGVAATTSMPGARYTPATWIDAEGDLWLFGGSGYDSAGTQGDLNDLWEYSPSTQEWTWVGGSSTADGKGVYGTLGVAAKSSMPGARWGAFAWMDSSGNLWLFGGSGYDSEGHYEQLNDLWEYSPSSQEWTWVAGSPTANANGVYGTQGVAANTNIPGARVAAVGWADASGNVWLFGGYGYDSVGNVDYLNDLWEYPTQ